MNIQQIRQLAETTIAAIDGVTKVDRPVKHRPRGDEMGGQYYGGHYCNHMDIEDNAPEYQLMKAGAHGFVTYGRDLFSVYYVPLTRLLAMMAKPHRHFSGWQMFGYVVTGDTAVVFLHNRPEFGRKLAEALGSEFKQCTDADRYRTL